MRFHSLNHVIISNLIELRRFELNLETTINSEVLLKVIEYLPYIEILDLNGELSCFNLDSLFNLKRLDLYGKIMDDFNFHLFDNLCNQLEYIHISCKNFDNRLTSLNAKSFVGLDNLKRLDLNNNNLVNFDFDIFDNIGKLVEIYLYENPIMNKDEILNRSAKSKIKVYLS